MSRVKLLPVELIMEGGNTRGFVCACGVSHRFSSYVYSHWRDVLTLTCQCEAEYSITNGKVRCVSRKPAPPASAQAHAQEPQ